MMVIAFVVVWASDASAQTMPVAKSFTHTALIEMIEPVASVPVEAPIMTVKTTITKDFAQQTILEIQSAHPEVPANDSDYSNQVSIPDAITANTDLVTSESSNNYQSNSGATLAENDEIVVAPAPVITSSEGGPSEVGTSGSNSSSGSSSGSSSKKIGSLALTTPKKSNEQPVVTYTAPVYEKKTFTLLAEEEMAPADAREIVRDTRAAASVFGLSGSLSLAHVLGVIAVLLGLVVFARKYQARTRMIAASAHQPSPNPSYL